MAQVVPHTERTIEFHSGDATFPWRWPDAVATRSRRRSSSWTSVPNDGKTIDSRGRHRSRSASPSLDFCLSRLLPSRVLSMPDTRPLRRLGITSIDLEKD